jgi:FixJ family two-component response regulator
VTNRFVGVIDDDETLCLSVVDLMQSIGYRAEPFFSAESFLMSADRFSVDCIIADVHMSGMSGLILLRVLREQRIFAPAILITALGDKKLDEEAMASGAQCLLRKPLEASCLLDWVERSVCR